LKVVKETLLTMSAQKKLCTPQSALHQALEEPILRAQGQEQIGERRGLQLARRRFQTGSMFLRGCSWVLRWREDVIENGSLRRINRSEALGTRENYPTIRLAQRAAADRLSAVNSPSFHARPTATFRRFATRWQSTVLPQHKPSTLATVRSHLKKYLTPFLGDRRLKEINPELIQTFIAGLKTTSKTVRNIYVTVQIV
jgi:hypothetical protein